MLLREELIQEIWKRLMTVEGVVYTARNPKAPPNIETLPAITFFELEDNVVEVGTRGIYPRYKRVLRLVVEVFVAGTSEAASTKEAIAFMEEVKKKLYEGGNTLSGKGVLYEFGYSGILRPPIGDNASGIGLLLDVLYTEEISELT